MKRKEIVKSVIVRPGLFSSFELNYISKRLPFSDEDLAEIAFFWAENIGHRERMAENVVKHGTPKMRAKFGLRFNSYKRMMKEKVQTAQEAYYWVTAFPEDSDEFIDLVKGGKWAFKWAKDIGDQEIMKSRIDITFWKMKFEKEIEKDEEVSFVSP